MPADAEAFRDRANYAAAECGARVVETNAGARGAHALLQPHNRDGYLANLCSAPAKYVVVELCAEIRVEALVFASYEPFASLPRDVAAWARRECDDAWQPLAAGALAAARRPQVLRAAAGPGERVYVRQVRIELLSHYGAEHYCVLSEVRVHGRTMLEDFEAQTRAAAAGELVPSLFGEGPAFGTGDAGRDDGNVFRRIHERIARVERAHLADVALLQRVFRRLGSVRAPRDVDAPPVAQLPPAAPPPAESRLVYGLFLFGAAQSALVLLLVLLFVRSQRRGAAPPPPPPASAHSGPVSPLPSAGPLLIDDAEAANVIDAAYASAPASPRTKDD